MKKFVTCLGFVDQAEQAVELYTSVFKNSRRLHTTRATDGMPFPKGSVISASFELDGHEFLAINGGPSFTHTPGMSVMVKCDSQAELDGIWQKLTANGGKPGPCGWLTDPFGVSWQVVPRVFLQMVADEDRSKVARVLQAMLQMSKMEIADLEAAYRGDNDLRPKMVRRNSESV